MKYTQLLLIVACFSIYHTTSCDQTITLFMRPYPLAPDNNFTKSYVKKFKKPGKIASRHFHGILQKDITSGIFSSYAGYLSSSDSNGQTSFPRKHEDPLLYLLITNKITPNIITGNTIHHWELEPGSPAEMYKIERKKDYEAELFYWDVKKVSLPKNDRIPLNTIIVFAKPKNIYVPTGASLAYDRPNLVLPDIYIKKGIKIYAHTLYVLNLKHFFGPIGKLRKQEEKRYRMHLNP